MVGVAFKKEKKKKAVCVPALMLLACLAALTVLRQTGLCAMSDVLICLTCTCQQEPLVRTSHGRVCVSASTRAFMYSRHMRSSRLHFLD